MVEGAYTGGGGGPSGRQLRPLGVGEVLDTAIRLYSRNAVPMWKIVLAVIVPLAVIQEAVIGGSLPASAFVHDGQLYAPSGQLSTPALGQTVEIVLAILGPLLVNGALALFLVDAYVGRPLDWASSLRTAGGRIGDLLWLAIVYGVLVFIGLVLVIIPGVWLAVSWSVAIPALMFEHVSGFAALRRSFGLVRHRWWPTFGALLVAVIMLFVVVLVVGLIFQGIQSGLGVGSLALWLAINAAATIVSALITYPFLAAVIAVLYIDLRVRKEGLSFERLTAGPEASWGEPSPPEPPQSTWPSPP